MARRTFFSFHFDNDSWRAGQVRNIGALDGNQPVSSNEWEEVKRGGDGAIKRWIAKEMRDKECLVTLIGSQTASRPWVLYEIEKAWSDELGVFGIHVHNLKDRAGYTASKGANPLAKVEVDPGPGNSWWFGKVALDSIAKAFDPPFTTSTSVYDHIKNNIAGWADEAIRVRRNYP